jgi:AmiR/NasT family two-component response regulator
MTNSQRALVADDDPIVLLFLHQVLAGMGYEVIAVEDGADLVDEALRQRPDVIVTDVRMPGLDGVQACHEICQKFDVPVVALTGYVDEYLAQRMVAECPVLVQALKPMDEAGLRNVIKRAVDRFGQYQLVVAEERLRESGLQSWRMAERAAALLAEENGVDEVEGFHLLRRLADDQCIPLRHAARAVLNTAHG